MSNGGFLRLVAIFLLASSACAPAAETLYAASVRTHVNAAPDAPPGTLYAIDPQTGAATVVAPLRLSGSPIGVTGLAIHPKTGIFYGITGRYSDAAPHSLVKINPVTGEAALIGKLGAVGNDIGFGSDGTLYTWLGEDAELGTIDIETGKATGLGPSNIQGAGPGGLAIGPGDKGYIAATGATGTLDRLDLKTGQGTRGPPLSGAPFPNNITNLSFSPSGRLYAVNASGGAPADTMLVNIDPATGVVTKIGPLPKDIEALIFSSTRGDPDFVKDNRSLISISLAVVVIAGLFLMMRLMARER
jgi:hypothetical protein